MKQIIFINLNIIGLIFLIASPVSQNVVSWAQSEQTLTTTIHIVQENETLEQIAIQYNVNVDAIIRINNIHDALSVKVGQQLFIPLTPPAQTASGFQHIVQLGDTLKSIAARYDVPIERLIEINHIVHPKRLYIGQHLEVDTAEIQSSSYGYYTVQNTDTAAQIAARFGMTLSELIALNQLPHSAIIFAGQKLLVRNGTDPSTLPYPLMNLRLNPMPPKQGQSVSIQFTTSVEMNEVEGKFLERPLIPMLENNTYYAIGAVHSFTNAGVYSLTLRFLTKDNERIQYELRFWVDDAGYGSEAINVPSDRANLLEPSLVQDELNRVAALMSGFNPKRYFNSLMIVPSSGQVTSYYGTRRSYNGSPYNTFHGGTDFGGNVGSAVTAPADGIVVLAEPLLVRGNAVIIDHGWGVYTGYWHLSEINVQVGQEVQKGTLLGLLGSTGLVTGAHLHWEMWVQGVQVDPMQWVQQPFP